MALFFFFVPVDQWARLTMSNWLRSVGRRQRVSVLSAMAAATGRCRIFPPSSGTSKKDVRFCRAPGCSSIPFVSFGRLKVGRGGGLSMTSLVLKQMLVSLKGTCLERMQCLVSRYFCLHLGICNIPPLPLSSGRAYELCSKRIHLIVL